MKRHLIENEISVELPKSLDVFLHDLAQFTGVISYANIADFAHRATLDDIRQLKSLKRKITALLSEDDEDKADLYADDVARIVKGNR